MDILEKINKFYNQEPKYYVKLTYGRLHYELKINRRLTILQGDSGTGKTVLLNILNKYQNKVNKRNSEFKVDTNATFTVNAPYVMCNSINTDIAFFDDNHPISSDIKLLQSLINKGVYVVIIIRNEYQYLSYAISEIYKIQTNLIDNRVHLDKYLNNVIRLHYDLIIGDCNKNTLERSNINKVIIEDSGTGYQVFKMIFNKKNIDVISTYGKNNIIPYVEKLKINGNLKNTLIIIDGVNYGQCIKELIDRTESYNCYIVPYESFEFMVLESLKIFESLADIVNTKLMLLSDKFNSNLEKVFESLLVKASNKISSNGNIVSNNISILDDLVDEASLRILGKNINYSKNKINSILFSEERLIELEHSIYEYIKPLKLNNATYTENQLADIVKWS